MEVKLKALPELIEIRNQLRADGKQVVFTNGCFDILHPGHLTYLARARSMGDALIVAINSDRWVSRLKGPGRPIMHQGERAYMLSGLEAVNFVTVFDQETPQEIIAALLPDLLVKGGDWPVENIVGRQEVEAAGGEVLSLPYLPGLSTTDIIDRIRRL
ncbi:MAG TPA: D-glycero-beta-D-manno-heptose 1-phosphate adenylyltransferase [Blastocatellia bacterium]|nr:D-glycero-beta-D-manno-heptose 1-phosphate adenylyltransferase [Blastocatellia bacterium]